MPERAPLIGAAAATSRPRWLQWLLQHAVGRVLLGALAVKLLVRVTGTLLPGSWRALDAVNGLATLALLFVVGYALAKGVVQAKRRLLWRVRRRLILSYVFIGLVPSLLVVIFFIVAGFLLIFNVSSYLLQSRLRSLVDAVRYQAESIALEIEHDESPEVRRRRLQQRYTIGEAQYPFLSVVVLPWTTDCGSAGAALPASPPTVLPVQLGRWPHMQAPDVVPRWITCDGFSGLVAYAVATDAGVEHHLLIRAVAIPGNGARAAVVVDVPVGSALANRLREESGVRLRDVTVLEGQGAALLAGRTFEPVAADDEQGVGSTLGQQWVAMLNVHDWPTGVRQDASASMQLNVTAIYARISNVAEGTSTGATIGGALLLGLAVIGVLFLVIQCAALFIGFMLARQITGAVHDLFAGTERLRHREFSYAVPVRARDQLGQLAESFNQMTGEITVLIRENAEKARLEQEMRAAREIQQRLLPSGPQSVPGYSITAFCEPAREVAGDYFDFLKVSPTQLGVLIADVSGKGLPAGLYMAQLKVLVQSLARSHPSPGEFLKALNRTVSENIDSRSFITMSYGVIDFESRRMTLARAGHCPLIRVPGNAPPGQRRSELIAPDGLVLGLKVDDGTMFDALMTEVSFPLADNDLLVFFTDGISETMDEAFECYGEQRLAKMLELYAHLPFEQLRSFLFADLRSFAGSADQHDDMTMIMLKVDPTAVA